MCIPWPSLPYVYRGSEFPKCIWGGGAIGFLYSDGWHFFILISGADRGEMR